MQQPIDDFAAGNSCNDAFDLTTPDPKAEGLPKFNSTDTACTAFAKGEMRGKVWTIRWVAGMLERGELTAEQILAVLRDTEVATLNVFAPEQPAPPARGNPDLRVVEGFAKNLDGVA